MLIMLFGLLDIFAGIGLLFAKSFPPVIILLLGVLMLIKGVASVSGSALQKYLFDWMGWIDIVAGTALLLYASVPLLWLIVIAKGLWSLAAGLVR